ncbi:Ig-like domain-containing protein [Microbacterium tenebrionis]|uniref:Ig-like domain-containing protein n=1 Tax=Microbacterium tenebrionis TaxID=2830665 RepID=UPI00158E15EE|nr:Ig-like domain-containing protein [Microbacterium ihumii]
MSTDDQPGRPQTRAEARAAREAAEREAAEAAVPEIPQAPEDAKLRLPPVAQPVSASEAAPPPLNAPHESSAEAGASSHGSLSDPQARRNGLSDERSEESKPASPRDRRFLTTMLAVVGVLVVIAGGLGAVSLFQGPRISQVTVDPAEAIQVSGSRVILTANQSLQQIDESQVTVEPAVPFTVDAAGRSIGIRFTVPLDDATDYTVSIAGVTGEGGGPASDLRTSFSTPPSEVFLLNRSDKDDSIFRTDLSGEKAVPVFTHARINDYRATATSLVVAVEDDDGSRVLVMDHQGENVHELTLPGDGYVSSVQVSDRGGLVGYIYSDRTITEDSGRASVLVTQLLSGDDEPHIVEVGGEEASIAEWQFVPDSAAVLFIDFAGTLSLDDRSGDAGAQNMGIAMQLLGVSRGTYTAIVERADQSIVELNLADGSETPLEASDPDYGPATSISPFPGGTLRHIVARDESGLPTGQAIIRVDDDGAAEPIIEVAAGSAILQACPSPSGQYAAVTVAPDLVDNAYDDMLVPLPTTLETHLIDLRSGEELVALTGFDVSWCQMAPAF